MVEEYGSLSAEEEDDNLQLISYLTSLVEDKLSSSRLYFPFEELISQMGNQNIYTERPKNANLSFRVFLQVFLRFTVLGSYLKPHVAMMNGMEMRGEAVRVFHSLGRSALQLIEPCETAPSVYLLTK